MNKLTIGLLAGIGAAIGNGIYPATARAVYEHGGNAMFMLLATTLMRAFSLSAFCAITRRPLFQNKDETKTAFTGGFFQALSNGSIFMALLYLAAPVVIVINYTHTLMLLLLTVWKKEIPFTMNALVTSIIALVGLTFVLDLWKGYDIVWIGVALSFVAAISAASRIYLFGKQMKTRHPAVVGAETLIFAAIFIVILSFFKTPILPTSLEGYGWALLGCISMSCATFGMFYGVSLLGSFNYGMVSKSEPIFTMLFAMVFLHEFLTLSQTIGLFMVIGSLIIYQYLDAKRQKAVK